jgi:hypothetical protein
MNAECFCCLYSTSLILFSLQVNLHDTHSCALALYLLILLSVCVKVRGADCLQTVAVAGVKSDEAS